MRKYFTMKIIKQKALCLQKNVKAMYLVEFYHENDGCSVLSDKHPYHLYLNGKFITFSTNLIYPDLK